MGVDYYLVFKNLKEKKAMVIYIGRNMFEYVDEVDINLVINAFDEIMDLYDDEKFVEIDETPLRDLTLAHISKLFMLKHYLDRILYDTNFNGIANFNLIIRVVGLIEALKLDSYDYEWEIVSDIRLDEEINKLQADEYEVWVW